MRDLMPLRMPERQPAVGPPVDLVAFLVHRAMVPAAQQGEVGQCGGPALCPVTDVVTLNEPAAAAREATVPVAVQQCPAEGGRDRPGAGADLYQVPLGVVMHDDPAGVAGQALRRFRGNAGAVLVDRTPSARQRN